MRHTLTILFLSIYLVTSGQKYSKEIRDTSIINFMSWLFKSDTTFKAIRHVDNNIIKLNADNFRYKDTSKINNFLGNIFIYNNHLDTIFDEEDANFFAKQINNQKADLWNLKLKTIKLLDEVQLDKNNRTDKVLYSYSLPLFSLNKQRVI